MIDEIINRTSIPLLHKMLNLSARRQDAIANNVANETTPGYRRQDVAFDELLTDSMNRKQFRILKADPRHISASRGQHKPVIQTLQELKGQGGNNNVNIETEMAEAVKNLQLYSTAAKLISGKFKSLQACIRGRF